MSNDPVQKLILLSSNDHFSIQSHHMEWSGQLPRLADNLERGLLAYHVDRVAENFLS
jgi:hypothetical protein